MKSLLKKTSWVCLYLAAFLAFCFAVKYFSEKNLLSAFIALLISMLA